MAKTFGQFQQQVDLRIQDAGAKLSSSARDAAITQAILQRYSKDRPQIKVTDVAGNGTALLDLPAGFEDGFSFVEQIEYPVGNIPPTVLEEEDWDDEYRTPTARKILLLSATPAASETLRVSWTARHLEDATTVPEADFEAVCDYAASLGFDALAARHVPTGDATLAADTVNYRTKSDEYLRMARALRRRYFNHLGIAVDESVFGTAAVGPAISIGEHDLDIAGSGVDRLTHGKRTR